MVSTNIKNEIYRIFYIFAIQQARVFLVYIDKWQPDTNTVQLVKWLGRYKPTLFPVYDETVWQKPKKTCS